MSLIKSWLSSCMAAVSAGEWHRPPSCTLQADLMALAFTCFCIPDDIPTQHHLCCITHSHNMPDTCRCTSLSWTTAALVVPSRPPACAHTVPTPSPSRPHCSQNTTASWPPQVHAVILGGTGAYNAAGATHFGVRKLISGLNGAAYNNESLWLPDAVPGTECTPIWLW